MPADWTRVKTLFDAALNEPVSGRSAWLRRACGADDEVRREVEELLALAEEAEASSAAPNTDDGAVAVDPNVGRRFGPYRIVRELGRGGMGAVYLAERVDDFRQQVAIKIVRQSLADCDIERRFRLERQVLASLAHPNIARLLDGGITESGEPFFVMEYVEGEPLLTFVARTNATLRDRLSLFLRVCEAVSHAHARLVVHRDLSPSNILVTPDGSPRLIDFGLAKVLDETLAGGADLTRTGFRAFTPAYASPEQVHGLPIGTATDVYSLGVILFELLSGRKPFEFVSGVMTDILRILDAGVSRPPSAAAAAVLREAARVPPCRPASLLGDLDNIVLTALRVEPERRYASVALFAEDLRRFLDGRPVTAHPNTAAYRARKFLRRHAVASAATSLAVAAVLGGLGVSLWQASIARNERDRATRRFEDVRRLSNSLLFELSPRIERLPGATGARDLLVRRALEYLDSLATEAAGDRALQRELAAAYEKIGDLQGNPTNPNLIEYDAAIDSYRKARRIRQQLLAAAGGDRAERTALAENFRVLGNIYSQANEFESAAHDLHEGLAVFEAEAESSPSDLTLQRSLAQALHDIGRNQSNSSRYAGAIPPLERAIAIADRVHASQPGDIDVTQLLADTCAQYGLALSWEGRQREAETQMNRAAALYQPLLAAQPRDVNVRDGIWSVYWLSSSVYEEQDDARAHAFAKRALDVIEPVVEQDPENVRARQQLAKSYSRLGQTATNLGHAREAGEHLEKAYRLLDGIASAESRNGRLRSELALVLTRLADARGREGRLTEALAHAQHAVDVFTDLMARFPSDRRSVRNLVLAHQTVGDIHERMARAVAQAAPRVDHRANAIESYRQALALLRRLESQSVLAASDQKLMAALMVKTGGQPATTPAEAR
ncbi:MAG: protein kinase [Vicinamibacterales bacterium]